MEDSRFVRVNALSPCFVNAYSDEKLPRPNTLPAQATKHVDRIFERVGL